MENSPGWRIWRIVRCVGRVRITQRESGHYQRLGAAYLAVATVAATDASRRSNLRSHWRSSAHAPRHCASAHGQADASAIDAAMADCVAASWHTLGHLLGVAAEPVWKKRKRKEVCGQSVWRMRALCTGENNIKIYWESWNNILIIKLSYKSYNMKYEMVYGTISSTFFLERKPWLS